MAESALKSLDFSCPICLTLLKDPVTLSCGHSFCLGCINNCWDQEDQKGAYSCPQCRHSFSLRPDLNKNTMLAELAEGLRKTRVQAAPSPAAEAPAEASAGSGVECDVCTGMKHTAVKSCLVCLASFCEAHIQPHYQSPAFKKHKLVETSINLEDKICSLHDKLLEIFCRDDRQVICYLCVMDKHRSHVTVSATAEKAEKQDQLGSDRETCSQTIQQKEEDVLELKQRMVNIRDSAQAAVEDSEKSFTELIQSIERRRSEVKELIRAHEKAELSQAEELLKTLEKEIDDLRRRDAQMETLSRTEDPISFLRDFQTLPALPGATNLSSVTTDLQFSLEPVKNMISKMEHLTGFAKLELLQISNVHTVQPSEPRTRAELEEYSCQLTLNPQTTHRCLSLSNENKEVCLIQQKEYNHYRKCYVWTYPEKWCQVLCSEPLSGCCYWEADISGNISVAVSYKESNSQSEFGSNDQSWSLECVNSKLYFRHSNINTCLNTPVNSFRIGVYLDHAAGILSFYNVSNNMTLLHSVHTTFTQPLIVGFGMKSKSSSVKILDLKEVEMMMIGMIESDDE